MDKYRSLDGTSRAVQRVLLTGLTLLGAVWALEIHHEFDLAFFKEQYLGLIFVMAISAVFIGVRSRAGETARRIPWYDWALVALTVVAGGYVVVMFPRIVHDLGSVEPDRWILGAIAVLLVLEATRRLVGWVLVGLAVVFIVYARVSDLFPGLLNLPSSSWGRIWAYLYLDSNALFGLPLDVTSTIIISFILFGRILYVVNGDRFLTDFAMATMGRRRGGAAKVAVLASSFFGTISGSAVSNVVLDGPITIPMMQKSGYPSHLAAATEAVASTGGQIMPPVMGITAFLIAEYLQIPYGEVIVAAFIPAMLYYVALFTQVDLEAAKHRMAAVAPEALPRMRDVAGRGWVFLIPIAILVWTLVFENWRPGKAGMAAVISTLIVAFLHRETRPKWRRLLDGLEDTGRTILDLVVITCIAGLVIGSLQLSGLGSAFSLILLEVAAGSAVVLLGLTAIVCIILGMGMPTGVIYIMLAVLVAPTLVEFGILPIAAHMFLFYFGMLSMITPPVCLATFAAAAIAGTGFWQAGWSGVRLAIVAYIVPFVMVFQPALLFEGSGADIAVAVAKALVGVIVLCVGVAGYLFAPLGWPRRGLFFLAGLLVFVAPLDGDIGVAGNLAGLAVGAFMVWSEWRANGRARVEAGSRA